MSICINNDLIWIAIPKNASVSIEHALLNSNLDIQIYENYKDKNNIDDIHGHLVLSDLYQHFGIKETVCIKRDWFERWLSSLEFFWNRLNERNSETIVPWEEVNNDLIYTIFNEEFLNAAYNRDFKIFDKITKTKFTDIDFNGAMLTLFLSQNHWKLNKPCTYEFDINEIHNFVDFIEKRYGEKVKIEKLNVTQKVPSKIVINNELRNFVWDVFERKYVKNNLI